MAQGRDSQAAIEARQGRHIPCTTLVYRVADPRSPVVG